MTLPTYNPEAKCPQCGGDDISTLYMDHIAHSCQSFYAPPSTDGRRATCWYQRGPHHHRTCRRCHYGWAEAVLAPSMARTPEDDQ